MKKKHIERAIRSVKNIADEIIVLDTGSNDNTIKIAQKEGAIIYNSTWENDFGKARNEAMEKATKDWILMLDADEILSKDSEKRLKPTLIGLSREFIYSPKIRNVTDDQTSLEEIYHFVSRIIPNRKDIKFIRPIHEYPVLKNGENIPSSTLTGIEIIHYGYSPKIIEKKNKIERNINILNKLIKEQPNDPLNYFYLSNMLFKINDYQGVRYNSQKALELIENKKDNKLKHIKILCQINIIVSLIFEAKNQEAKDFSEKFREDLENRPDYWFLYATAELNLNNYDKSIEYSHNALKLKGEDIYPSVDVGTITWKPLYLIAKAYYKKQELDKSIEYCKKAIKENPENISLYIYLTDIYIKQKDFKSIEKVLANFISKLSKIDISALIKALSTIYIQENRYNHFLKLLELIRTRLLIGNALEKEDKILADTLLDVYYQILNKSENKLAIKYSIACIKNYINLKEEAKNLFYEILLEKEDDIDTICNLASISLSSNDLKDAEDLYNKAILLDSSSINALEGLTKIEIIRNNFEKAYKYLDKIKEIDPENSIIKDLEFEIINKKGDKKLASDMYASMIINISMN
ncbi:MAG: hypothetical protein KatS3mg068_2079 [Candidatus Sericytochromatia bacterium]|nr:MAG: hypothetical protein KatS3mg068_2079 [Candidatus Sericytochromatia bacterium]